MHDETGSKGGPNALALVLGCGCVAVVLPAILAVIVIAGLTIIGQNLEETFQTIGDDVGAAPARP